MTAILLSLLLAANPVRAELPTERVAILELEHVYDRDGAHLFDQILAREWEPSGYCEIREYRLTKKITDYPRLVDGLYVVPWGGAGQPRRVTAPDLVETWHQWDSEICERKRLSVESRRRLFQEKPLAFVNEIGDPLPPAPE